VPYLTFDDVRIAGISACVPDVVVNNLNSSCFSDYRDAEAFVNSTGVIQRRISTILTSSDLGYFAAEKLISELSWERETISCLIFVSQTSDYPLPATSCILQDRLGLSKDSYAADISLGCSGWVYGLSLISSLVSAGNGCSFKRAILIAGDAKAISPPNNPLFGFASTATAIEFSKGASPMFYNFGTDGSRYDAIIIPDGGARNGISSSSFLEYEYEGKRYNRLQPIMSGIDVFSFAISTVPKSVRSLVDNFKLDLNDFDKFVFHQANKQIISTIVRKLGIDVRKVPISIDIFGNTSSASIPLTIVNDYSEGKINNDKLLCSGFGVGLSWGTVAFESQGILIPAIIEVEDCIENSFIHGQ